MLYTEFIREVEELGLELNPDKTSFIQIKHKGVAIGAVSTVETHSMSTNYSAFRELGYFLRSSLLMSMHGLAITSLESRGDLEDKYTWTVTALGNYFKDGSTFGYKCGEWKLGTKTHLIMNGYEIYFTEEVFETMRRKLGIELEFTKGESKE